MLQRAVGGTPVTCARGTGRPLCLPGSRRGRQMWAATAEGSPTPTCMEVRQPGSVRQPVWVVWPQRQSPCSRPLLLVGDDDDGDGDDDNNNQCFGSSDTYPVPVILHLVLLSH